MRLEEKSEAEHCQSLLLLDSLEIEHTCRLKISLLVVLVKCRNHKTLRLQTNSRMQPRTSSLFEHAEGCGVCKVRLSEASCYLSYDTDQTGCSRTPHRFCSTDRHGGPVGGSLTSKEAFMGG